MSGLKRGVDHCTVEGCDRLIFAKTWCKRHYDRAHKYGSPLALHKRGSKKPRPKGAEVFWTRVDIRGDDECWEWQGHIYKRKDRKGVGYGRFSTEGRHYLAHRYSFQITHGMELKSYTPVHHKCGNTVCVNPKHLQQTTTHENTAEMLERTFYLNRIAELEAMVAACTCS